MFVQEWKKDTALQAALGFLVLFLPYFPAHSHPVIAMVMWSCFPSVSGRNSNSSMAPTRFFILYPTHSRAETQVSEITQQGETLLIVEVPKKLFGSFGYVCGVFFLSKTLSKSVHYLEPGMEPTWSFWTCVIRKNPSRKLFLLQTWHQLQPPLLSVQHLSKLHPKYPFPTWSSVATQHLNQHWN